MKLNKSEDSNNQHFTNQTTSAQSNDSFKKISLNETKISLISR